MGFGGLGGLVVAASSDAVFTRKNPFGGWGVGGGGDYTGNTVSGQERAERGDTPVGQI